MADILNFKSLRAQAKAEEAARTPDPKLIEVLEELREAIDHQGASPILSVAGVPIRVESDNKVHSIQWDGIEFGCRVIDKDEVTMMREIFIKFPQPVFTIPESQRDPITLAVFNVFLMEGQGEVHFATFKFGNAKIKNTGTHNCLRIRQDFSPLVLTRTETAKTHIKIDDNIEKLIH